MDARTEISTLKWNKQGRGFRATVSGKFGCRTTVVPVSAEAETQWKVTVRGIQLERLFNTPTEGKQAARTEWTRIHTMLLS